MKLIPRALRPMTFIRRRAMRSGVQSQNDVVRLLALVIVGRPALVRQTANRLGFVGSSRLWRMVAYGFLANDLYRKVAVKQPDRLGTEKLLEGEGVTVLAMHRPTKRERRRSAS